MLLVGQVLAKTGLRVSHQYVPLLSVSTPPGQGPRLSK